MRGPLVFKGYWNLEKDTEYTFRGGWDHTGDVGRFDSDGYLWYVKRKAEFVGGRNARYKKPRSVQFVSSLPKNEAGFINREKVKAIYGVK